MTDPNRENKLMDEDNDLRHKVQDLKLDRDRTVNNKEIKDFENQIDLLEEQRAKISEELELINKGW